MTDHDIHREGLNDALEAIAEQPPSRTLPSVLDTDYFMRHQRRLDFTQPGDWVLDGYDTAAQADVTTTQEGPLDATARRQLAAAYPGVVSWQARPATVDETYTDSRKAACRIQDLIAGDRSLALGRAVLEIAASEEFGFRFEHRWDSPVRGAWGIRVDGDDDEQSFRIRTITDPPGPAFESFDAFAARWLPRSPETVLVPVSREQARRVIPVLRDWANAGDVTVACLGVANAIDQAMTGADQLGGTRAGTQEGFVRDSFARLEDDIS